MRAPLLLPRGTVPGMAVWRVAHPDIGVCVDFGVSDALDPRGPLLPGLIEYWGRCTSPARR